MMLNNFKQLFFAGIFTTCFVGVNTEIVFGYNVEDFDAIVRFVRTSTPTRSVIGGFRIPPEDLNLSGACLRKQNFSRCIFNGTNFAGAALKDVDFSSSTFVCCKFDGANLRGANLAGVRVDGCSWNRAYLRDAKISADAFRQMVESGLIVDARLEGAIVVIDAEQLITRAIRRMTGITENISFELSSGTQSEILVTLNDNNPQVGLAVVNSRIREIERNIIPFILRHVISVATEDGSQIRPPSEIEDFCLDAERSAKIQRVNHEKGFCPVCQEDFTDCERVAQLPCSHMLHKECADTALSWNPKCPECRQKPEVTTDAGEILVGYKTVLFTCK
jgi:hypothetical protein